MRVEYGGLGGMETGTSSIPENTMIALVSAYSKPTQVVIRRMSSQGGFTRGCGTDAGCPVVGSMNRTSGSLEVSTCGLVEEGNPDTSFQVLNSLGKLSWEIEGQNPVLL